MDKYFDSFREMISLRGLTDHTLKSYCTYIRAYLDYLTIILHKAPEDVSWDELRDYIRWLQKSRGLSDRTVNCVISQLRFFTIYVLHKTWDDTQLPMHRFDEYLPYLPSKEETWQFISSMPDLKPKTMVALMYSSGLRIGEVCRIRYEDVDQKNMRLHITHSKNRNDRYAILSKTALDLLTQYWFECGRPMGYLFPKQSGEDRPIDTFFLSRHIHAHEDRLGWERRLTCHSFRHSSVTYKLKLNGGDIKAVQGDSGHSQATMVSEVYSHIIDDDRRRNAELFENAFYKKKNLNPSMHEEEEPKEVAMPEGVDQEMVMKVLSNPEMMSLISALAKTMK